MLSSFSFWAYLVVSWLILLTGSTYLEGKINHRSNSKSMDTSNLILLNWAGSVKKNISYRKLNLTLDKYFDKKKSIKILFGKK
jgi:hypothetical protein